MTEIKKLKALCEYPYAEVSYNEQGELGGATLAVKDIYPVVGYPNGWGSPTRLKIAEVDQTTQISVQKLVDHGAKIIGKSQCDELCFSLNGVNVHYGAPVNGAAPDRITGGSSSGSASLVSNGAVDIATGSDTGGSIRAPASYCGLIGLRATHNRISLEGAMALAPSYDCFGWFAKDYGLYQKVGEIMLGEDQHKGELSEFLCVAELDAQLLGQEEKLAFDKAMENVERREVKLPFELDEAYWVFRICQAHEAHLELGQWIEEHKPELGQGIKERFDYGANLKVDEVKLAKEKRIEMTKALEDIVGENGVIVFPTAPSCAPLRSDSMDNLQEFREKALKLLCLSGNSGLPQLTLPLCSVHSAPMGISLMAGRGSDRQLLNVGEKLMSQI